MSPDPEVGGGSSAPKSPSSELEPATGDSPAPDGAAASTRSPTEDLAPGDRPVSLEWLERVAQLVRNGPGLSPEDDVDALRASTRREALDRLLEDPRFADTVLDFNLFFLGFKEGRLRDDAGDIVVGQGAPFVPSALASVQAYLDGGDYLVLLDGSARPFLSPLIPDAYLDLLGPATATGSADSPSRRELREARFREAETALDALVAELSASNVEPSAEQICAGLLPAANILGDAGIGAPLLDELSFELFTHCGGGNASSPRDPLALAEVLRRRVRGTRALRETLEEADYFFRVVGEGGASNAVGTLFTSLRSGLVDWRDVRSLDPSQLGLAPDPFSLRFWAAHPNSSTNHNRKRAAYVLDRFFCDDLAPVNAALPEVESADAHAASPSCRSCHYKLDPMAGFFKANGALGLSFGERDEIIFDDGATAPRVEYEAAWRAPEGSGRRWNIGFIRSATNEATNDYGESLADLFRIARRAPETKRCLVQRMFEYAVGEDQSLDPGYVDEVTIRFTALAELQSSLAFRETMKTVLASETFARTDRRGDTCYDLPAGARAEARPPCRVASILKKNCGTCHAGVGAQGGLDLTTWRTDEAGRSGYFPHREASGAAVPSLETFRRMLDRVSTTDPSRAMPLGASMPVREREALVTWLGERLEPSEGLDETSGAIRRGAVVPFRECPVASARARGEKR